MEFILISNKRAYNKSDHHLAIFKADNQTNLFVKKVRLSSHFWMSNRTFMVIEVGYKRFVANTEQPNYMINHLL